MSVFDGGVQFERPPGFEDGTLGEHCTSEAEASAARKIAQVGVPLADFGAAGLDGALEAMGPAQIVLIGESTHGTTEFYHCRCELTKRLILERDTKLILIEADFPCALPLNWYVHGDKRAPDVTTALQRFQGNFPAWMWRNYEVKSFLEWLRDYNSKLAPDKQVSVYGLDMQGGLQFAMDDLLAFAAATDLKGDALAALKENLQTFAPFTMPDGGRSYADALSHGRMSELAPQAAAIASIVREQMVASAQTPAQCFELQRLCVAFASWENYYRASVAEDRGYTRNTWNIRDQCFFDCLLEARFCFGGGPTVAWAHNSHLGDARATELGAVEWNLGQLARENFGEEGVFNVGFSTFEDDLTASKNWDGPTLKLRVKPAASHSYGELLHQVFKHIKARNPDSVGFAITLRRNDALMLQDVRAQTAISELMPQRLQRMIGVQYKQDTERQSHYFCCCLPLQFDYFIHFDNTTALEPMDGWQGVEEAK